MKKTLITAIITIALVVGLIVSCSSSDDTPTPTPPVATLPVLTTNSTTSVTQTTAISGGNVTSDGGKTITARGICWATAQNPTTANSKTSETGTTGNFASNLTNLTANTLYYVRAYATNSDGTAYGNQVNFTTGTIPATLPLVTTTAVSAITFTSATSGGNVSSDGGGAITARGICYATATNPTITNTLVTATGTTGAFSSNLTALSAGTTYYVRAYATNSAGTGYGSEVTFSTSSNGPTGGNAICNGSKPTVVVPITSSTGKIWMDRNLGASRAANAKNDFNAYGCFYQWGRSNDGHASMTWVLGQDDVGSGIEAGTSVNGETATLSSTDNPGNSLFIYNFSGTEDWRNPKNDNLWQGINGVNNPCPSGYRIPTKAEFVAEINAYAISNTTTAFNSIHKIPASGQRSSTNLISGQGNFGTYWTSSTSLGRSYQVLVTSDAIYTSEAIGRSYGLSVRCIKN
jgi:uncharacterized protein (TIGR02145 family)